MSATPQAQRRQRYCSNACRQRAYRQRLATRRTPAGQPRGTHRRWAPKPLTVPLHLDRFIGRAKELEQLRALRDHPLVTLTGAPGAGKSRLAARHIECEHTGNPDRVLWIDVDRLEPGTGLESLVGEVLDPIPTGPRPPGTLPGDQKILLVLDNCEQRVDEAAFLVENLLMNRPDLCVRITSREALRIPGEVVVGVGPLAVPEPADRNAGHRGLLRYDAAQLFVERASSSNPNFVLSQANATAIAELCAELDGLPLSIEFAARWVGMLSVVELLTRVRESTAFLTVASRTASDRHSSQRAVFDASYAALEPAEQALFRRLSVLDGPFGLAPAGAVAGLPADSASGLTDLLSGLQAKSLLTTELDSPHGVEFHPFRSLRRYAAERLADAGETDETWGRLADWLLARFHPTTRRIGPLARAQAEDPELDQLHGYLWATIEWADRRNDPRNALLVAAAARTLCTKGDEATFRHLATRALRQSAPASDQAVLLIEMATSARLQGRVMVAQGLAARAVSRASGLDDGTVHGRALIELATCERHNRDFVAATTHARTALSLVGTEDTLNAAACLEHLATTSMAAGDLDGAGLLISAALHSLAASDTPHALATAHALNTAADVALTCDRVVDAEACTLAALSLVPPEAALLHRPLSRLAAISALQGAHSQALRLREAARSLRRRSPVAEREWLDDWVEQVCDDAISGAELVDLAVVRTTAEELTPHRAHAFALGEPWPEQPARDPAESQLPPRQRTIALLVAEGLTNRQIASRLGVSSRTVVADLCRLRDTLELQSRAQVAAWARTVVTT
ncbi:hypothetical protein FH609_009225 [Streptomyces sp. 3MP-14]|uniref:HTH luxR-type domain-containing protein n=1 Tax=Streptomyces mimosae TaxID=2586635 RepID=A0A5N6AIF7_9ACTN|nr:MULTISPECIES: LuxR C-terminal-related transcriptional regulator [Streptomyces]KAB8167942.1 hypothetical protein FH607_008195 [Streptomyces mimosae]KAB8177410.1 hypothetical protein FH609_009225 [Streptomyces sp. 3MP-14]